MLKFSQTDISKRPANSYVLICLASIVIFVNDWICIFQHDMPFEVLTVTLNLIISILFLHGKLFLRYTFNVYFIANDK